MITTTNVNNNLNNLTAIEIQNAYEDIEKACTRQFYNNKTIDKNKINDIFEHYFNKDNPILNIDASIPGTNWNPLMITAWLGFKDNVNKILKLGANPEVFSVKDNKAVANSLHLAITASQEDICLQLIDRCPKLIYTKTSKGQTPLMLACEAGLVNVVEKIISFPDINILEKDNDGNDFEFYCNKANDNFIDSNNNKNIKELLRYFLLNKTLDTNFNRRKTNKI